MDHAFDRYFDTAGLFGTPQKAAALVEELRGLGVDELACLIDFGVDADVVLDHLPYLKELMELAGPAATEAGAAQPDGQVGADDGELRIAEQIVRHGVTHLQCTPSMARMLLTDPAASRGARLPRTAAARRRGAAGRRSPSSCPGWSAASCSTCTARRRRRVVAPCVGARR